MALGATLYGLNIDLADSDRGVYESLELRVPRHPSESADYFVTRVLAFCVEYSEGIEFSKGLFAPEEPTIAVRDLTGELHAWIDVGAPEAARLHRAGKASPRVVVYTHKDPRPWLTRIAGERIHRAEALELYSFEPEWLSQIAARLERRMAFSLTVAERHVYLTLGETTFECDIRTVQLNSER